MKKLRQFIKELEHLEKQYPDAIAPFDVRGAPVHGGAGGRRTLELQSTKDGVLCSACGKSHIPDEEDL